tara:strand:- start:212 stop:445 length:234 start_codon:yes stop_codon:yes gene_type:complete
MARSIIAGLICALLTQAPAAAHEGHIGEPHVHVTESVAIGPTAIITAAITAAGIAAIVFAAHRFMQRRSARGVRCAA